MESGRKNGAIDGVVNVLFLGNAQQNFRKTSGSRSHLQKRARDFRFVRFVLPAKPLRMENTPILEILAFCNEKCFFVDLSQISPVRTEGHLISDRGV